MTLRISALLNVFALACLALCSPVAHADLLWSYAYSSGTASGSGYLTTGDTLSSGAYPVTGISGFADGAAIRALYPAGIYTTTGGGTLTSDNLLYSSSPSLDFNGITFRTPADLHNLYFTGGHYYDLAGADCAAATCGDATHLGKVVSFAATLVPSIEWYFTYSGAGVSGSGYFTTLATPVGGSYSIVGLSGTQNGVAMNALLPGGTYAAGGGGILTSDNLLSPVDPFLDLDGFTFNAGPDHLYNIYAMDGTYYDLDGALCSATGCGTAAELGTPITFSVTRRVPEPGTLPLLAAACTALGYASRRRRIMATRNPRR